MEYAIRTRRFDFIKLLLKKSISVIPDIWILLIIFYILNEIIVPW